MSSLTHFGVAPIDGEPPPDEFLPAPGIVIQIQAPSFLEPMLPPCLDEATRGQVIGAIKALVGDRWPKVFVGSVCVTDPTAGEAAAFGVWPGGPADPNADQLDELLGYLREPIGRTAGESIAFRFTKTFLDSQVASAVGTFNSGTHMPDPDGATHVQKAWVELQPPDTVVTKATGYDERPVPDVDFTFTVTEQLTRGGDGQFDIQPVKKTDVDDLLPHLLDFWLMLGYAWPAGLYQEWELDTTSTDIDKAGIASALVAEFLRPTIPIPGREKLTVLYTRADATADAVQVGGFITGRVPRTPAVSIDGPTALEFSMTQTLKSAIYKVVRTADLLPPVTVAWILDGQPSGTDPVETLQFSAPAPNTVATETVSVTVTDSEGLRASAEILLQLSSPREDEHHHHGPEGSGGPLHEV